MPENHRGNATPIASLLERGRKYYDDAIEASFPDISVLIREKVPMVIFGAARMGRLFKTNLEREGVRIIAFGDSSPGKWGTEIGGTPVYSPDALMEKNFEAPILVASLIYETEICGVLKDRGFGNVYPLWYLNHKHPDIFVSPEYRGVFGSLFTDRAAKDIPKLWDLLADDESRKVLHNLIRFRLTFDKGYISAIRSDNLQYFEEGIVHLFEDTVFLDCGAYTGDTVEFLHQRTGGSFKIAYCFEPDPENYRVLDERATVLAPGRIIPVRCGLYSSSGSIRFQATGSIDARMTDGEGSISVPVVSIDDYMADKAPPTYIKMDIEGAEREALAGARRTILRWKPELAVSVYHKATDLWEIPLLMKRLNRGYKLFLRHYTTEIIDTVCYAC
jgi:FkbM family methyltransferase